MGKIEYAQAHEERLKEIAMRAATAISMQSQDAEKAKYAKNLEALLSAYKSGDEDDEYEKRGGVQIVFNQPA
jgi:hypothetical protein